MGNERTDALLEFKNKLGYGDILAQILLELIAKYQHRICKRGDTQEFNEAMEEMINEFVLTNPIGAALKMRDLYRLDQLLITFYIRSLAKVNPEITYKETTLLYRCLINGSEETATEQVNTILNKYLDNFHSMEPLLS